MESFQLHLKALFWMARPLQLGAVFMVYLLGRSLAAANGFAYDPPAFLLGLAALLLVSVSIHYANEYADYDTDARSVRTPFSGGSGALQATGLPRRTALRAAWAALLIGAVVASFGLGTARLNWLAVAILTLGGLLGWLYSLGPFPLARRGLGELDNALLGGILLPLYGYVVQTGRIDWPVIAGWLPFGALVFTNLLATTWADREADASVGKRTLATRWPRRRLRMLYAVVALGAFILLPFLVPWSLPAKVAGSGFLILPLAFVGAWKYTRIHSPLPSVAAMGGYLLVQLLAWWV